MLDKIIENLDFGLFSGFIFLMAGWFILHGFPIYIKYLEKRDRLDREAETERRLEDSKNLGFLQDRDNLIQKQMHNETCKLERQIANVQGQIENLSKQFLSFTKVIYKEIEKDEFAIQDIKHRIGLINRHYDKNKED